jgi:hypothetical protein
MDGARELAVLPSVFQFLFDRRESLRRRYYPWAGSDVSSSEQSADRGDAVMAMYETLFLGGGLPESQENWSLREKPDNLRHVLVCLLSDVHHFADVTELDWEAVLSRADAVYESEIDDDKEDPENSEN